MPQFPLKWLYLDLNSYFASVEQQLEPSYRGKPVAVVPVMSDSTCAIAASYEAKALGIKTGTRIWEAKELCPEIILAPARHDAYVEYHHKILKEIDNHLPITQICSIDEVACKLMDNEAPPEVALKIAKKMKKGIADNVGEYLRSSIGIAPNKYLAKVATELEKPNGLVVLNSDDIEERLSTLKLRDLPGIGYNMEMRLRMAGIGDVASLFKYSPKQMRRIWHSVWGEKMWYMLRGFDIPDVETNRSSVGHSHVLAPDLRDPAKTIHVAMRLTVKAATRLRRLQYHARSFSLSVRLEDGGWWGMEGKCVPAQDNIMFLKMLEQMWAMMRRETKSARLKKVSVTMYNLVEDSTIQNGLFDYLSGETKQRSRALSLSRAMDKLNGKFGRDTVSIGMLPEQGRSFSGTKIAFTRIPDVQEFVE